MGRSQRKPKGKAGKLQEKWLGAIDNIPKIYDDIVIDKAIRAAKEKKKKILTKGIDF